MKAPKIRPLCLLEVEASTDARANYPCRVTTTLRSYPSANVVLLGARARMYTAGQVVPPGVSRYRVFL